MASSRGLERFKQCLEVAEAARYLSAETGDEVTPAEVLRYGLDKHLRISVRLVNKVHALAWELDDPFAATYEKWPQPDVTLPADAVFDLPLVGGERLDVENAYHRLTDRPPVAHRELGGVFVDAPDGTRYLLFDYKTNDYDHEGTKWWKAPVQYAPFGRLPKGSILMVRRSALAALIGDDGPATGDLGTREKDTLLTLLAAALSYAKLDIDQPTQTAKILSPITVDLGREVAPRTVIHHLKAARELYSEKK